MFEIRAKKRNNRRWGVKRSPLVMLVKRKKGQVVPARRRKSIIEKVAGRADFYPVPQLKRKNKIIYELFLGWGFERKGNRWG